MKKTTIKTERFKALVYLLSMLFLLLTAACLWLVNDLKTQKKLVANAVRFNELLIENQAVVPGYTCGVLTTDIATELLNEPVSRESTNVVVPVIKSENISLRTIDICRYVSRSISTKYIELHITTYADSDEAAHEFTATLPLVGNFEKLDASNYGERLMYGDGVYFILRGRHVIQVAAANGSPVETMKFGRRVLDIVYPEIIL